MVAEGGGGRGWQRRRAAEYDAVSSLYPHCILTVSLQREAEGGEWKAEGGGRWWREDGAVSSLYPQCIPAVSSLYPHCIPPKRGVCGGKEGGGGGGKMRRRMSKEEEEGRIGKRRRNEEEEEENV